MTHYEDHPIAAKLPLMDGEEFASLVASLKANGFDPDHPIRLYEGKILDGRNRYRAAMAAGVKPVVREWDGSTHGGNPWRFVIQEALPRREFWDKVRKAAVTVQLLEGDSAWEDEQRERKERADREAREAMAEAKRGRPSNNTPKLSPVSRDTRVNSPAPSAPPAPPPKPGPKPDNWTRTAVAAAAGVSPATAQRALSLRAKSPETFERVADGQIEGNKALAAVKLEAKHALAAELRARPVPAPKGPFGVIVIDPPWPYETRTEDLSHRGNTDYPLMPMDQIIALPVGELAADDTILWLWTTNAFMRQAYQCLDAWGFQEKTILTWIKDRMGAGNWLRNITEHCILAVRGKPLVTLTNQTTVLRAPRREHSRKPDEFWTLVDSLCPDSSRLEMFARESRPGWQLWGAETGKLEGTP